MVDWTVLALGLPEKFLMKNSGGGIINTTISEGTFLAIHVAKRRKMKELNIELNDPKTLKFVGYYAEFCYAGADKALFLKNVHYRRAVPSKFCQEKYNFVLDIEKFREMLKKDVEEGLIPFFYSATYGSTFSAAVDLTPELIEICKQYKMWISLDAAYLGPSWFCPELRPNPELFEAVDSIGINFSKTMLTGVPGSPYFVADKN